MSDLNELHEGHWHPSKRPSISDIKTREKESEKHKLQEQSIDSLSSQSITMSNDILEILDDSPNIQHVANTVNQESLSSLSKPSPTSSIIDSKEDIDILDKMGQLSINDEDKTAARTIPPPPKSTESNLFDKGDDFIVLGSTPVAPITDSLLDDLANESLAQKDLISSEASPVPPIFSKPPTEDCANKDTETNIQETNKESINISKDLDASRGDMDLEEINAPTSETQYIKREEEPLETKDIEPPQNPNGSESSEPIETSSLAETLKEPLLPTPQSPPISRNLQSKGHSTNDIMNSRILDDLDTDSSSKEELTTEKSNSEMTSDIKPPPTNIGKPPIMKPSSESAPIEAESSEKFVLDDLLEVPPPPVSKQEKAMSEELVKPLDKEATQEPIKTIEEKPISEISNDTSTEKSTEIETLKKHIEPQNENPTKMSLVEEMEKLSITEESVKVSAETIESTFTEKQLKSSTTSIIEASIKSSKLEEIIEVHTEKQFESEISLDEPSASKPATESTGERLISTNSFPSDTSLIESKNPSESGSEPFEHIAPISNNNSNSELKVSSEDLSASEIPKTENVQESKSKSDSHDASDIVPSVETELPTDSFSKSDSDVDFLNSITQNSPSSEKASFASSEKKELPKSKESNPFASSTEGDSLFGDSIGDDSFLKSLSESNEQQKPKDNVPEPISSPFDDLTEDSFLKAISEKEQPTAEQEQSQQESNSEATSDPFQTNASPFGDTNEEEDSFLAAVTSSNLQKPVESTSSAQTVSNTENKLEDKFKDIFDTDDNDDDFANLLAQDLAKEKEKVASGKPDLSQSFAFLEDDDLLPDDVENDFTKNASTSLSRPQTNTSVTSTDASQRHQLSHLQDFNTAHNSFDLPTTLVPKVKRMASFQNYAPNPAQPKMGLPGAPLQPPHAPINAGPGGKLSSKKSFFEELPLPPKQVTRKVSNIGYESYSQHQPQPPLPVGTGQQYRAQTVSPSNPYASLSNSIPPAETPDPLGNALPYTQTSTTKAYPPQHLSQFSPSGPGTAYRAQQPQGPNASNPYAPSPAMPGISSPGMQPANMNRNAYSQGSNLYGSGQTPQPMGSNLYGQSPQLPQSNLYGPSSQTPSNPYGPAAQTPASNPYGPALQPPANPYGPSSQPSANPYGPTSQAPTSSPYGPSSLPSSNVYGSPRTQGSNLYGSGSPVNDPYHQSLGQQQSQLPTHQPPYQPGYPPNQYAPGMPTQPYQPRKSSPLSQKATLSYPPQAPPPKIINKQPPKSSAAYGDMPVDIGMRAAESVRSPEAQLAILHAKQMRSPPGPNYGHTSNSAMTNQFSPTEPPSQLYQSNGMGRNSQSPLGMHNSQLGEDPNVQTASPLVTTEMLRRRQFPLFCWGSGTKAVVAIPPSIAFGGTGTINEIKLVEISQKLDPDSYSRFPAGIMSAKGPNKSKKKELEKWIEEHIRIINDKSAQVSPADAIRYSDRSILWKILLILVRTESPLTSANRFVVEDICKILDPNFKGKQAAATENAGAASGSFAPAVDIYKQNMHRRTSSNFDQMGISGGARPLKPEDITNIMTSLTVGDREGALQYSLDQHLWAHALILASSLGPQQWTNTVAEFVREDIRHLPAQSARTMALMYRIFSGAGVDSISEILPANQSVTAGPIQPSMELSAVLRDWKSIVCLSFVNNSPMCLDPMNMLATLLFNSGYIEAAHTWYV